jgi:hypothetical protein
MKSLAALLSMRGLAILLMPLLLAACDVVVEEGPIYRPLPPQPGPQFCTREYAPVCARRGGDRQTFANACRARQQGYRIISPGTCRGEFGGGGEQRFCTREYAPVCARRGGALRTFLNACEARAADWRVIDDGPC